MAFKFGGEITQQPQKLSFKSRGVTPGVARFKPRERIFSGGFFSDVADVFSIPQFAATGLFSPEKTVGQAVRERFTPGKALKIKSKVGRFATDLLLDPINLAFGAGLIGKGVKGVGKLSKSKQLLNLGSDIARFSKKGEPLFRATGAGAKKLLKPIGNIPEVKGALEAFKKSSRIKGAFQTIQQKRFQQFAEARQGIKESKLVKALEKLSPAEKENIVPVLQRRASPVRPSKDYLEALEQWEKWAAKEASLDVARGSLTPKQVKERIWKPLKKVTGKSAEELKDLVDQPVYVPGIVEDRLKNSDFFLPKRLQRTKPGHFKEFKGFSVGKEADPDILVKRRQLAGIRHRIVDDHITEVKKVFGVPVKKLKDGSRVAKVNGQNVASVFEEGMEKWIIDGVRHREFKPSGALKFFPLETATGGKAAGVTKNVESFLVPEPVHAELTRFFGKKGGLEKLTAATLDPLTDLFKVSVLGLSPRWIFNNFFGNLTVNTMAGVTPSDYIRALKSPGKLPKGLKGGVFKAEQTATALRRVLNNLKDSGQLGELAGKPFKALLKASEPGFKLNSRIEEIFRTANFLSGKKKGLSNSAALKQVNKWLFDYTSLKPFERRVMKKFFPFWSWTRNINALAAKLPLENPAITGFIRNGAHFVRDLQTEGLIKPTGDIPMHPVFSKMLGSNEKVFLNIKSAIPFNDVGNVLNVQGYLNSLNPFMKVGIEQTLRTQIYKRRPFTSPSKDVKDGRVREPVPPLWRHIASISPHFRLAEDLYNPIVRFGTGEPLLRKGKPIKKSRAISAIGLLGPKFKTASQVRSAMKREGIELSEEAKRELAKREKFEKQRANIRPNFRAGGGELTF